MHKKQSLLRSFGHAFHGMYLFFLKDRNGGLHLLAALLACGFGVLLDISAGEWAAIVLCIAMVIGLEMINASIEKLSDMVHEEFHPVIKSIKDMGAAAVLWAAMASVVIGIIIFFPKIIQLL